jgi:glycosyltransferase involved in cell wall biosynthesis
MVCAQHLAASNTACRPTVGVIMPALDEEASVGATVRQVPRSVVDEVIVVDNGSTDRTAEVARLAGARVVHEPQRGYGAACWAGVQATESDVLVFLDADGSFDGAEIPTLIEPLCTGQADLVLGSRSLGQVTPDAMPAHQRFGNQLTASLLQTLFGMQVSDLGPFRAIGRSKLLALNMSEMSFGWPTEMMVKAARMGYRVVEVPVTYRCRIGGRSKVSGNLAGSIKAGWHIMRVVLRHAGYRRG